MAGFGRGKTTIAQKPPKKADPNFGLPSPGELVSKIGTVPRAQRGMGSKASASPAPKAPKVAKKPSSSGGDSIAKAAKAADRAFARQRRQEASNKPKEELGAFYLNATSGMFSPKAGGKKK